MPENVIRILSQPGIKRDGTQFEGDNYVDGQWVRFQRGLPRKIGGYRSINKYLQGLVRTLHTYTQDSLTYVHAGSAELIERLYIDSSNNTSVIVDRTPTSGFTASSNNLWQFDTMYDSVAVSPANKIVAQVAPNLECICNSTGGELFSGDLLGTSPLTSITLPTGGNATGGVVVLHPYLIFFGNAGYWGWSVPGDPADLTGTGSGDAVITGQKILRGLPLRGGPGSSPSGLFWSADSLLRAAFVGGTTVWQFDTLSSQTSMLSAQSAIEYDGIFYWIGSDRFLSFNGVVREVPNNLNINFFFDNLNYQYRQKVFATKVPRFGEIWWCFPKGDSTEPNHAIIYNVRENTWYDCALPEGGRGAGAFPTIFRKPLMTGVAPQRYSATEAVVFDGGASYTAGDVLVVQGGSATQNVELTVVSVDGGGAVTDITISNAGSYTVLPSDPVSVTGGTGSAATFTLTFTRPYQLWIHETGKDAVDGLDITPIESYFETADISVPVLSGKNRALQVLMIEPDFVQAGDMTIQAKGRANARGPNVDGEIKTIVETPSTPQEQVAYFKTQRRQLRFRFTSNVTGGDYQMGQVLAHVQEGDGTVIG